MADTAFASVAASQPSTVVVALMALVQACSTAAIVPVTVVVPVMALVAFASNAAMVPMTVVVPVIALVWFAELAATVPTTVVVPLILLVALAAFAAMVPDTPDADTHARKSSSPIHGGGTGAASATAAPVTVPFAPLPDQSGSGDPPMSGQ